MNVKDKIYLCKIKNCNVRISYPTVLYGLGMCRSCSHKGKTRPEHSKRMKGLNNPMFNKTHNQKTKDKISKSRKGKYCGKNSPNFGKKCPLWSIKLKELWKNVEFRNKMIKASMKQRNLKPNKPEKLLNKLLRKILFKKYKYVGNGEILISGFNPDFINCNGQKKIIEMYGDYWHNLESWKARDKRRLIAYRKYGYKTLIIWEHELKNLEKVKNKLLKFEEV